MVAIIWLWLYGGGLSSVHATADGFTSIGRITGTNTKKEMMFNENQ